VLQVMAGIMAVAAVVAVVGLRAGVQEESDATRAEPQANPSPPPQEQTSPPVQGGILPRPDEP